MLSGKCHDATFGRNPKKISIHYKRAITKNLSAQNAEGTPRSQESFKCPSNQIKKKTETQAVPQVLTGLCITWMFKCD